MHGVFMRGTGASDAAFVFTAPPSRRVSFSSTSDSADEPCYSGGSVEGRLRSQRLIMSTMRCVSRAAMRPNSTPN